MGNPIRYYNGLEFTWDKERQGTVVCLDRQPSKKTVAFKFKDNGEFEYYNKADDDEFDHPKEFAYRYIVCYKLTMR